MEKLGKYELYEEIGHGGFATVYRAIDTALDRQVALKILKPHLMQDRKWIDQFHQEAKVIASLEHPRIITIHEISESNGRHFIAMRYMRNGSLQHYIQENGPLTWPQFLQIAQEIAEALDFAHEKNILHRDLKPCNILLDEQGHAVLTDFGLAKILTEASTSHNLSTNNGILGTPNYLAREIWEGEQVTAQTDIYAFGCVCYEMLVGRKLFGGDSNPAIMRAHFTERSWPKDWPKDVPPHIEHILDWAVSIDSKKRPPYANQIIRQLNVLHSQIIDHLYQELEKAINGNNWDNAILIARQVRAKDEHYRDIVSLEKKATDEKVRFEKMAHWQANAENFLAENDLKNAKRSLKRWHLIADGQSFSALSTFQKRFDSKQKELSDTIDSVKRCIQKGNLEAAKQSLITGQKQFPQNDIWQGLTKKWKRANQQATIYKSQFNRQLRSKNYRQANLSLKEWATLYHDDPTLLKARQELKYRLAPANSWREEGIQALKKGALRYASYVIREWEDIYPTDPYLQQFKKNFAQIEQQIQNDTDWVSWLHYQLNDLSFGIDWAKQEILDSFRQENSSNQYLKWVSLLFVVSFIAFIIVVTLTILT